MTTTEVQVKDGIFPEPPKTFQELKTLMTDELAEYKGLNVDTASILRDESQIRLGNLMNRIFTIVRPMENEKFISEFIADYHFWTGVPLKDLRNMRKYDLMKLVAKCLLEQ